MNTYFSSSSARPANDHRLLIQLRQVVKVYKTAAGDFTALRGISADLYAGEFVGVIGKSGAGKSTLLNMITGSDMITSGEVVFNPPDGKSISIHNLSENSLAVWRGRNVGLIYQSFYLMPTLNLLQNVVLPMDVCGGYRPGASQQRALELLRMVELEEHAHKLPSAISGGQQQRVAIARALANDPKFIVADEPTGRLDSVTAEIIFQIFTRLVDQAKTIIMVTHDQGLSRRMSRTLRLVDGQIEDGF